MKHFVIRHRAAFFSIALLAPQIAYAQAEEFFDIFVDLVSSLTPIIGTIAVLAIVILGVRMVGSTEEAGIGKMRTTMAAIVMGLFMTLLTPNIVNVLYYDQVISGGGLGIQNNANLVRLELLGIAEWLQALAVIVGVATIIVAAFRAIASFGDDGAITSARRQVLYGVIGLLIVIFASTFFHSMFGENTAAEQTFFDLRSPNPLVAFVFYYVNILLGFLLLIMIAILIYAGLLMVLNLGNDSRVEQAKGMLLRAVTGLILVLFSVAIVRLILYFFGDTADF